MGPIGPSICRFLGYISPIQRMSIQALHSAESRARTAGLCDDALGFGLAGRHFTAGDSDWVNLEKFFFIKPGGGRPQR